MAAGADTHGLSVTWTVALPLVLCFAAAEVFVVHLEYRRNAHTFSLVEVPLVVALVAAPPSVLVAAHLIGAAAALVIHRRQRSIKVVFNLATFALQDVVAIVLFDAFDSTAIDATRTWIGLLVACVVGSLLSLLLVQAVMWVSGDHPNAREALIAAGLGVTFTCITAAAAVAAVILWDHERVVALVAVPAFVRIFLAQRIQVATIVRRQHVAAMDSTLAGVNEARSVDEVIDDLLAATREMFSAREAVLVRQLRDGCDVRRCHVGEATAATREPAASWDWLQAGPTARTLGRTTPLTFGGREVARGSAAAAFADRMAVAVHLDDLGPLGPLGDAYLVVADKLSDVGRFGRDDADFLQLMARQFELAVNTRAAKPVDEFHLLELELNHRVRRDALTGLANEFGLAERIDTLLRDADAGRLAAVAISYQADASVAGTIASDDLTLVVSQRLTGCLRGRDTLARWAPEVFVAAVSLADDPNEVMTVARRVVDVLSRAVNVSGVDVHVDVRIGICTTEATTDPTLLVEQAVVASLDADLDRPVVVVLP